MRSPSNVVHLRPTERGEPVRREPAIPNGVFGMLAFVITEVMLFAGLISAHMIAKGGAQSGWPPPGQPRLPLEGTAFNSLLLVASGVLIWRAGRALRGGDRARAVNLHLYSMTLGAFFVLFQGYEWVGLIAEGLTLSSSTHGSFFYLIVGTHALHAVVALGALAWAWARLRRDALPASTLWAVQILWYFVVGVWPFLYLQVYL